MKYLLDTNVCIKYLNVSDSSIARRFAYTPREQMCVCPIVQCELYYGACKSERRTENLSLLDIFFSQIHCLEFSEQVAKEYGYLRAGLESQGRVIGAYDMMIAAFALAYSLTLVSHNHAEFEHVSRLMIEDWES